MQFHVVQHIHVVDECLVGGGIDLEITFYETVPEPFGTHEVEVVGGLQAQPAELGLRVGGLVIQLLQLEELAEGFLLELVANPFVRVLLFAGAGDGPRRVHGGGGDIHVQNFLRCDETVVLVGDQTVHKIAEEIEDPRVGGIVLPDGLVVPIQVDERRFAAEVAVVEEPHVFVSGQRVLVPTGVVEAQRDVVAQLVGAEQQAHIRLVRVAVQVGGALPTQNVAGTLGEDDAVAGVAQPLAYLVRIDDFRVAETYRLDIEGLL